MKSYLDHNATAPLRPEVIEAMTAAMGDVGNASSVHAAGRAARKRVEDAREAVAALAGARPRDVIFTAGGTEANALAATGTGRPLLASAVEHDSILAWAPEAQRLPVDADGRLDLSALEAALARAESPPLVALQLANNETGVLQPVAQAAALVREAGGLLHCDAVQGPGKLAFSLEELGCDLLSLSAHKFGGPQGVGALVVRPGLDLAPLLKGGGQEQRRRAGTENVAGIVGFGAAARHAEAGVALGQTWAAWRDAFEAELLKLAPKATVFARGAPRLPQTSCFALPGRAAETLLMTLDLDGFALSSGSACSSGKVGPSHVLAAMGASEETARGALRVSFGWNTARAELDALLAALRKIHEKAEKAPAA